MTVLITGSCSRVSWGADARSAGHGLAVARGPQALPDRRPGLAGPDAVHLAAEPARPGIRHPARLQLQVEAGRAVLVAGDPHHARRRRVARRDRRLAEDDVGAGAPADLVARVVVGAARAQRARDGVPPIGHQPPGEPGVRRARRVHLHLPAEPEGHPGGASPGRVQLRPQPPAGRKRCPGTRRRRSSPRSARAPRGRRCGPPAR
jgi:hypothetical protein